MIRSRAQQVLAVARLEIRKGFLGRRALPLYLLAALPVLVAILLSWLQSERPLWRDVSDLQGIYANFFQGFILRTIVYFGSVWLFSNLFRGEVVDRSLHFYLLAPIRRESLVLGKYLAGMAAALVLFGGSAIGSYLVLFVPHGGSLGVETGQLATYVSLTALGALGYGAFFLFWGMILKNPVVPAVMLFGWEWANFLLPPLLKKLSVVHYLKGLMPVPISEGPFALVGDPVSGFSAIAGLATFAVALLLLSALWARRLEVDYGGD